MPTPQKEALIVEMTEKFTNASSIFLADFTGIDVNTINKVRQKFYDSKVEYRVVKNTLAKISLNKAGINQLDDYLTGVTAYAISYDDPVSPIKVIEDFKKDLDGKMAVKVAIFEGEVVTAERVEALSKMPNKQEMLGQLVGMLQSPMTKLAGTLSGAMSSFVGVLKSLEEKKQ